MEGAVIRGRTPLFLALFAVAGALSCDAQGDRPGIIILPGMVESIPLDTWEPSDLTPSGGALMAPPAGTIPVGHTVFPFGPGEDEAARAGRELSNPLEPTAENLARGEWVYATYCQVCHGPAGEGDGPIIGTFPNPPNLLANHTRELEDGRIYHVITLGQELMPAHGTQVPPDDRWKSNLYLRQLQEIQPAEVTAIGTGGTP
jgi:mono/diheme cytochrome c family protein